MGRVQAFAPPRRKSASAQQAGAHGTPVCSTFRTAKTRPGSRQTFRLTESVQRIKIAHDLLVRVL
jgi:hypothetical protein